MFWMTGWQKGQSEGASGGGGGGSGSISLDDAKERWFKEENQVLI